MGHLDTAKALLKNRISGEQIAQAATAHALIAIVERLDKLIERLGEVTDEDNGSIRVSAWDLGRP